MTTPALPLADALDLLRAASGSAELGEHDPRALAAAIPALGARSPSQVDEVGEALVQHELTQLMWPPLDGARLVGVLLAHGTPSTSLLQITMIYLSMYFQELDGPIAECRNRLAADGPPAEVASTLQATLAAL